MGRGQAYTLEGTIGAIIVVGAVLFGLQAVDTGPWTATPDRVPDQLETQAADLLTVGAETGALSTAVRCWGADKPVIDGEVNDPANSRFEQMLHHVFDQQNREYNLYLSYWNADRDQRVTRLVSANRSTAFESPDAEAAVATRELTLFDTQRVRFGNRCTSEGYRIGGPGTFEIPDVNERSAVYNVVEVQIVVW